MARAVRSSAFFGEDFGVRVELREFERSHEIEPASLVLGVAGGKELHGAAFIHLVDQDALVARVLNDLRRARKAKKPLHAVELEARALGQDLGGGLMRLLETREPQSRVQGRQVVALEVFDEGEERHLVIGDVEFLVCRDGAEALCRRFIVVSGGREQAPEGFEPAVTGDDLVPGADLADGDGLKESMIADACRQLGQSSLVHLGARLVRVLVQEVERDPPRRRWRGGMGESRDRRGHVQAPGSGFDAGPSHESCRGLLHLRGCAAT